MKVPSAKSRYSIAVVVQSLSCVQLFATSWTAAYQASLSFTVSQSLLKFTPTESVMLSNHLILFCFQSFPASGLVFIGWEQIYTDFWWMFSTMLVVHACPIFPWPISKFIWSHGRQFLYTLTTFSWRPFPELQELCILMKAIDEGGGQYPKR